jgi:hypothetical protein
MSSSGLPATATLSKFVECFLIAGDLQKQPPIVVKQAEEVLTFGDEDISG